MCDCHDARTYRIFFEMILCACIATEALVVSCAVAASLWYASCLHAFMSACTRVCL